MKFNNLKKVRVLYNSKEVGILSKTTKGHAAFQYSKHWIETGFSISPFSLPLVDKVFIADSEPFDGLFGVFNDSLPDGWGRLLVDRYLKQNNMNPGEIGFLERLTLLSSNSMGGIEYEPMNIEESWNLSFDLDHIKKEFERILNTEDMCNMDQYLQMAGSSGGARPKIHTQVDGKDWIIKFPSSFDRPDIGKEEYDYSLAAKECGIEMTDTRLFASKITNGYFGTERFDRKDGRRVHVISASGLLEASHRYPSIDYEHLFKASLLLSKDDRDLKKIFKLMCFNIYAHNMDDHAKNFSFIYKEGKGYVISPAYDLTYSSTFYKEHSTSISGHGKPNDEIILTLGRKYIRENEAKRIMSDIKEIVSLRLSGYLDS